MNLHTNLSLFEDAILAAAQRFGIPEIYIEKDYWITFALYTIFHSKVADQAVFKGGTALSKCHRLVERFSEDVDIVVLREESESGNRLKNKIKAITDAVSAVLPEVEITGITNKIGQIRKTAHHLRNHGFLLTPKGWVLSPAYDINPVPNSHGLSLNISEYSNALDLALVREVAKQFRVDDKKAEAIISKVIKEVYHWQEIAGKIGIPRNGYKV